MNLGNNDVDDEINKYILSFNKLFSEYIRILSTQTNLFPESYVNIITRTMENNNTKFIDMYLSNVVAKFQKDEISNDINGFIEKYTNSQNVISKFVDTREIWKMLNNENKKKVTELFLKMYDSCDEYAFNLYLKNN